MSLPRYQEIDSASIPVIEREDGVTIRLIAGAMNGLKGPVTEIAADPIYLDATIPGQASFAYSIERGHTALAYVFEGKGRFGITDEDRGEAILHPKLVVFVEGDYIKVEATGGSVRFLLFSGKPSHEPIVRYGPFVMNTREEIEQALRDLRNGTFVR